MIESLPNQTALNAIQKALTLLRSVQALEGTDKDSVEHLLEFAVENLRGERQSARRVGALIRTPTRWTAAGRMKFRDQEL
jgi:hypothetical protein